MNAGGQLSIAQKTRLRYAAPRAMGSPDEAPEGRRSPDGSRLAVMHQRVDSDVVLLRDGVSPRTVFSLVHDAHATTAEDIEKSIVRDCALWHGRQGL
jgi:hypothetical protein